VFKEGIVHVLMIAKVIGKVVARVGAAVVSSLSRIIVVTGWNGTSAATRSNLSKTWGMSVVVSRNGRRFSRSLCHHEGGSRACQRLSQRTEGSHELVPGPPLLLVGQPPTAPTLAESRSPSEGPIGFEVQRSTAKQ
jgi:hypothetical protein